MLTTRANVGVGAGEIARYASAEQNLEIIRHLEPDQSRQDRIDLRITGWGISPFNIFFFNP